MRMLEDEVPGAVDTIYLCNFRVSVDGDWLCLKELQDVDNFQDNFPEPLSPSPVEPIIIGICVCLNMNVYLLGNALIILYLEILTCYFQLQVF